MNRADTSSYLYQQCKLVIVVRFHPLLGRMQCVAVSISCPMPSVLPPHSPILTTLLCSPYASFLVCPGCTWLLFSLLTNLLQNRQICLLFQATAWLLELCDVALQTQVDVSHDIKSAQGQQVEQRKLEETAKVSTDVATRGTTIHWGNNDTGRNWKNELGDRKRNERGNVERD